MTDTVDPVKRLKDACDLAYDNWQHSCSDAVWDIIRAVVDSGATQIPANESIDYWDDNWTSVTLEEGFTLANKGVVVVGGLQVLGGHGHVIAIYPGPKIPNGGYQYFYKKANKYLTLPASGTYPRVLSTSMGRIWPGAMSKGDKTVWDPWGKDETFKDVEFWAPPASF